MGEVFIKPCEICGAPMEVTYETKATRFCPTCKIEHRRELQREKNERFRAKQYAEKRAKQIAHQQDTTVWTHDYAERQKAKTLAMIGRIL